MRGGAPAKAARHPLDDESAAAIRVVVKRVSAGRDRRRFDESADRSKPPRRAPRRRRIASRASENLRHAADDPGEEKLEAVGRDARCVFEGRRIDVCKFAVVDSLKSSAGRTHGNRQIG